MKNNSAMLISVTFPSSKEESAVPKLYQSPYLRAILTDKRVTDTAKIISVANSSMAAALRYISNSR